ncbi:MAG: hypothetical protein BAA01_01115 [Bacillus thermozeamaize]|uniref:Uncharacterized protein n=1 Tax=Bacillus thermozeamaize TaxID=230954 RepID=A0A1Y3PM98_9BACI|nr:MAG: hypothetical protein BAA01_01115 [Bacillus thermozeamaize]
MYQERYYGSNCTHFTELLAEYENIRLSASSVRRILIQGGLRPARVRRRSVGQPASLTTFGQAIADLGITHIEAVFRKPKDASSGFGEPFRIVW